MTISIARSEFLERSTLVIPTKARISIVGDVMLRCACPLRFWPCGRKGESSPRNTPKFDREVIFHCGGGWRSSVSFYCAWLMGYENIFRWLEWLENRLRAGSIG